MEHAVQQHINSKSADSSKKFFGKNDGLKFFPPVRVQPKLTTRAVDDPYEREADAIAQQVMRMPDKQTIETKSSPVVVQKKCAACEDEEKIQRKPGDNIVQTDANDTPSANLAVPSDFDDRPQHPPYVNHYQLVFAPLGADGLDSKINFNDFNLDLIQRGKIDPADFAEDYANLWKTDYKLSANLGLGKTVGKLYGLGGRVDSKILKPVRKVVRKIPILSPLAAAIKYEPPVPPGGDWDRYLADKFATSGLDAAVSGDYAAYNSESGFVFTINIIEKKWK
jgi:hypothetical protein